MHLPLLRWCAQASIEEARNHLAVVKSSEFSSARSSFAELQARQQAVLDTVGPNALLDLLTKDVDKVRTTGAPPALARTPPSLSSGQQGCSSPPFLIPLTRPGLLCVCCD